MSEVTIRAEKIMAIDPDTDKSHYAIVWFWWTEGEEEIGPFESYDAARADAIAQGHSVKPDTLFIAEERKSEKES